MKLAVRSPVDPFRAWNPWKAHIMKLSNLLHDWSTKLRIKEHDQLDACVKSIPEWDKDTIMLLGAEQVIRVESILTYIDA